MNNYSNEYVKIIFRWTIGTRLLDAKFVRCFPEIFMVKGTYENPRLKSVRSVFGAWPSPLFHAEAEKSSVLHL
jgi:hypothetical protein